MTKLDVRMNSMWFPDPSFRSSFKSDTDIIKPENWTTLTLVNVINLQGLDLFKNLQVIKFKGIGNIDLTKLTELPDITHVIFDQSLITKDIITYLTKLPKLLKITFRECVIQDFSNLKECKSLQGLVIQRCEVFDLSALSQVTTLLSLTLYDLDLKDPSFILSLNRLVNLDLDRTRFIDTSAHKSLQDTRELDPYRLTDNTFPAMNNTVMGWYFSRALEIPKEITQSQLDHYRNEYPSFYDLLTNYTPEKYTEFALDKVSKNGSFFISGGEAEYSASNEKYANGLFKCITKLNKVLPLDKLPNLSKYNSPSNYGEKYI